MAHNQLATSDNILFTLFFWVTFRTMHMALFPCFISFPLGFSRFGVTWLLWIGSVWSGLVGLGLALWSWLGLFDIYFLVLALIFSGPGSGSSWTISRLLFFISLIDYSMSFYFVEISRLYLFVLDWRLFLTRNNVFGIFPLVRSSDGSGTISEFRFSFLHLLLLLDVASLAVTVGRGFFYSFLLNVFVSLIQHPLPQPFLFQRQRQRQPLMCPFQTDGSESDMCFGSVASNNLSSSLFNYLFPIILIGSLARLIMRVRPHLPPLLSLSLPPTKKKHHHLYPDPAFYRALVLPLPPTLLRTWRMGVYGYRWVWIPRFNNALSSTFSVWSVLFLCAWIYNMPSFSFSFLFSNNLQPWTPLLSSRIPRCWRHRSSSSWAVGICSIYLSPKTYLRKILRGSMSPRFVAYLYVCVLAVFSTLLSFVSLSFIPSCSQNLSIVFAVCFSVLFTAVSFSFSFSIGFQNNLGKNVAQCSFMANGVPDPPPSTLLSFLHPSVSSSINH